MIKVGFQGNHGTFSEIATLTYFKNREVELAGYKNFISIMNDLDQDIIQYAVLPVENTTTGIISRTYDLFQHHNVHIEGELNVPIHQNLIVVPGTKLEEIEEVYSHPEALSQCANFFEQNPRIRQRPYQDTAKSVEYVKEMNDHTKAALGSWRAAEYYGMESLIDSINDSKLNMTRFLIVTNQEVEVENANKISMMLVLKHTPGALYNVLGILAKRGINILKLESRPIQGKIFEYQFYVDITGNLKKKDVKEAIHEIQLRSESCMVFGNYVAANS